MNKMRVVQVTQARGPFQMVEREIPEPPQGSVRVKVQACGICHSDLITKEGHWPGMTFPRIPGHEVAGVIDAIGPDVKVWQVGQRVGIGWHGGHCGYCDSCRRGQFVVCQVSREITGITRDGGYTEYMLAHAGTLALIPDELSAADAAPLMCAGVTTYNSMRNSGARSGDKVAILGIGGLGHLAVQFASKMGFHTIAIARGKDKEPLARKLGARHYIDSRESDPGVELQKLGGAKLVVATVTNAKAMTATLPGLGIDGKLLVLGAPAELLEVPAGLLIGERRSIAGWPSGSSIDSQDTLRFCALTGIRPMNEIFPLDRAEDAYNRMMSGEARFRVVISIEQ
jgi:D-arabinose 1-dehydrogenase-like Zn-dependent alcohol dehydrogenase